MPFGSVNQDLIFRQIAACSGLPSLGLYDFIFISTAYQKSGRPIGSRQKQTFN
jgi:hypothetical protein